MTQEERKQVIKDYLQEQQSLVVARLLYWQGLQRQFKYSRQVRDMIKHYSDELATIKTMIDML